VLLAIPHYRSHHKYIDTLLPQTTMARSPFLACVEFVSSRIVSVYQSNLLNNLSLATAIVGFWTILFLRSIIFTSRRFFRDKYPPGPPALPFFGNLFQLSMDAWVPFTEWKSTYGESFLEVSPAYVLKPGMFNFLGSLVYVNVAGQPVIILNNQKVATDLLDRRADIYSDRPNIIVASEFLAGGLLVTLMQHGDMYVLSQLISTDF
jgi:hypothetical protein